MKLKMFEEDLDLSLLVQMKELIEKNAKINRIENKKENLFIGSPAMSMEEQYGLHYPGEVLERYIEHCGAGIAKMRALAFALVEERELLEKEMFIGQQYNNFFQELQQQAKKEDIYIICALYLLTDQEENKEKLFQKIQSYCYEATETALLAVYTLQNRPDAWDWSRGILDRFLGMERTIKIYENERAYQWFLERFYEEIKKERHHNGRLLKGILQFACKNIKESDVAWGRLEKNGYTKQEMMYMNCYFFKNYTLVSSITMKRMAFSYCKEILNAEMLESRSLLMICGEFFEKYQHNGDIIDNLNYEVSIKCEMVFRYLYQEFKSIDIVNRWLYVNLNDDRWNSLVEWMQYEQYLELFGRSIIMYGKNKIDAWLNRYYCLMGEEYWEIFWRESNSIIKETMSLLVKYKKFDLVAIFGQYVEEAKENTSEEINKKWKIMLKNIGGVVCNLSSHEIFRFWEFYDMHFGISTLKDVFGDIIHPILNATECRGYGGFSYIDLKRHLLSKSESKILFDWIEQLVYEEMPLRYNDFLYGCLSNKEFRKLFPVETRELLALIYNTLGNSIKRDALLKKIYSKEEWNIYVEMENRRKELEKQKRREQELEEYKNMLYEKLNASKDSKIQFNILNNQNEFYWKSDEFFVWFIIFEELLKTGSCLVDISDAADLMEKFSRPVKKGWLTWETVIETLSLMKPDTEKKLEE